MHSMCVGVCDSMTNGDEWKERTSGVRCFLPTCVCTCMYAYNSRATLATMTAAADANAVGVIEPAALITLSIL